MLSLDNRDVSSELFFLWLQLGTRTLSKTPRMQRRVGLPDSAGVGYGKLKGLELESMDRILPSLTSNI